MVTPQQVREPTGGDPARAHNFPALAEQCGEVRHGSQVGAQHQPRGSSAGRGLPWLAELGRFPASFKDRKLRVPEVARQRGPGGARQQRHGKILDHRVEAVALDVIGLEGGGSASRM